MRHDKVGSGVFRGQSLHYAYVLFTIDVPSVLPLVVEYLAAELGHGYKALNSVHELRELKK